MICTLPLKALSLDFKRFLFLPGSDPGGFGLGQILFHGSQFGKPGFIVGGLSFQLGQTCIGLGDLKFTKIKTIFTATLLSLQSHQVRLTVSLRCQQSGEQCFQATDLGLHGDRLGAMSGMSGLSFLRRRHGDLGVRADLLQLSLLLDEFSTHLRYLLLNLGLLTNGFLCLLSELGGTRFSGGEFLFPGFESGLRGP